MYDLYLAHSRRLFQFFIPYFFFSASLGHDEVDQ